MNLGASIAFAAGLLSVYVGAVAWRMATAPGWRDQRWFAVLAFGAATYGLFNIATTAALSDAAVLVASHIQLAACFVQVWAWSRYGDTFLGRRPGPREQWAVRALLALGAASLVPGLPYDGTVALRSVPLLGVTHKDAVSTLAGDLLFAVALAAAVPVLLRMAAAWRRGVPHAGLHAASFLAIFVFGINDALAAAGVLATPYLLDVGFMVPVAAVALSNTRRFVRDAEALHALQGRLESLVEQRTRLLTRTEEALHQAEKLAALGQFASGVAHEVNNPASVVSANLNYLADVPPGGTPPPDARETIAESLEAMQRINALVRKLVDAGRQAAASAGRGVTPLLAVAEQVVAEGRARTGQRVDHTLRVPSFLQVGVPSDVLRQILAALVSNAGDAVPPGRPGRIEVKAELSSEGRVRVTVRDDGGGLTPEAARRAFEPFFTTKPEGRGSGLGLTVARALAESHGGSLHLEPLEAGGAQAVLELLEAPLG
jgi:signal transduction histidine kinase